MKSTLVLFAALSLLAGAARAEDAPRPAAPPPAVAEMVDPNTPVTLNAGEIDALLLKAKRDADFQAVIEKIKAQIFAKAPPKSPPPPK